MQNTPEADNPPLIRSQLGDYLSPRTAVILENWIADVKSDLRLTTADTLPKKLLEDHIPVLLDSFITYLHSGAGEDKEITADKAEKHGAERWGQGYSIKELVWEIYKLRTVLLREVVGFARNRPDELAAYAMASEAIDLFLNDTEYRSLEKYMEESKAALTESNGARLRLLRTISHELRNMLNSVGIASTMLESGDIEGVEAMRDSLGRNSEHMREVLDDLLGLSHILSPESKARPSGFEASDLIFQVDAAFRSKAEGKGLRFSASVKDGVSKLYGDESKLLQITSNLVSNAIEYTHKGSVELSFENVNPQQWAIVVKDTGIGIAKQDRQHIFSEFYQVNTESPLRGSGLGLAIVAGLVELLGGTISLESEESHGSIFRVLLPKKYGESGDSEAA